MYWERAPCPGTGGVFLVLKAPGKEHEGLWWDRGAPRAEHQPPVLLVLCSFAPPRLLEASSGFVAGMCTEAGTKKLPHGWLPGSQTPPLIPFQSSGEAPDRQQLLKRYLAWLRGSPNRAAPGSVSPWCCQKEAHSRVCLGKALNKLQAGPAPVLSTADQSPVGLEISGATTVGCWQSSPGVPLGPWQGVTVTVMMRWHLHPWVCAKLRAAWPKLALP